MPWLGNAKGVKVQQDRKMLSLIVSSLNCLNYNPKN